MSPEIKAKLSKIYELVKRGTEGEQKAAQAALDRMLSKYNLEDINLDSLELEMHKFKYSTWLEEQLMITIINYFLPNAEEVYKRTAKHFAARNIRMELKYLDYVTISCAYEYFRRHMRAQWNKTCAPLLAKCRKAKTRNKLRKELQPLFLSRYIIASKLYHPEELKQIDFDSLSKAEQEQRLKMQKIEGGKYTTQVQTGHMLEAPASVPVVKGKTQMELFG